MYTTWVLCFWEKSRKSKTETVVRKSSEIFLLKWKMAPEHSSGERNEKKKRKKKKIDIHTTPAGFQFLVVVFFSSCKRSLFVQTRTESGQITKGTSLSTQATTTHRPVQHQPHQHIKRSPGQEIHFKFHSCAQCKHT